MGRDNVCFQTRRLSAPSEQPLPILFAPCWHVLLLDVLLWTQGCVGCGRCLAMVFAGSCILRRFTSRTTHENLIENATHASLPCLLWTFKRHVACNRCSGSSNLQTAHNLKHPHTISHLELAGFHPMHVHLPGIATSNNWQPKLHLVCCWVKTAGYGTRFRDDPPQFMLNIHKSSIKGFKASC